MKKNHLPFVVFIVFFILILNLNSSGFAQITEIPYSLYYSQFYPYFFKNDFNTTALQNTFSLPFNISSPFQVNSFLYPTNRYVTPFSILSYYQPWNRNQNVYQSIQGSINNLIPFLNYSLPFSINYPLNYSLTGLPWYYPQTKDEIDTIPVDKDLDGLDDAVETNTGIYVNKNDTGTDPLNPDTDGDGCLDGVESKTGIFKDENNTGTDPLNYDTDWGGMNDGLEVKWGFDPLDDQDDPCLNILAWVRHGDRSVEYSNAISSINQYLPECSITESVATDSMELNADLEGKNILLLPKQAYWSNGFSQGELFGEVLRDFVRNGGLVIALFKESGNMLRGAGLMDVTSREITYDQELPLRVTEPDHPVFSDISNSLYTQNATCHWFINDSSVEVILTRDKDDAPIIAVRSYNKGGVVLIGFDYYQYDDNTAKILANTVQWSLMFWDSDNDGIPNSLELKNGLDPKDSSDAEGDLDEDMLSNISEAVLGTEMQMPDTDGDGLIDGLEVHETKTDPMNPDTDNDSLLDGVETNTGVFVNETNTGTDPLNPDTDGEGIIDSIEIYQLGTDPLNHDTDWGGMDDLLETTWGFDPLNRQDDFPFNILAWVEYADMGRRYPNTLDAIHQYIPVCSITESTTTDPNELAEELEGKNILLLPAQENLYNGFSWGELFGEVLKGFVEDGGLIIALHRESGYILEGAGLMDVTNQGSVWDESLRILAPDHPLSEGVAYPVTARESTNNWLVEDPDVEVILSREIDDSPIIAARSYGNGGIVLIGFDYYEYDDNSARFLGNSIEWSLIFCDRDADGIPYHAEMENGLDPKDPSDAEGDLDDDMLSNLSEFSLGTDMQKPDTDEDGLTDGVEVHEKMTNPLNPDTDGDGITDATDPFPLAVISARLEYPSAGISGSCVPILVKLTIGGEPIEEPVPLTLQATGSANFAEAADVGFLHSGGGTNSVVLETTNGQAQICLLGQTEESVGLTIEDTENYGIVSDYYEDFELNDGMFTHSGTQDTWEWGTPTSGPASANSGTKVWATNLSGSYSNSSESYLQTPVYMLPSGKDLELEFWHWFSSEECCDRGQLMISVDEGEFVEVPSIDIFRGNLNENGYNRVVVDLTPYAGHTAAFRFAFHSDGSVTSPGWYIDDFRISFVESKLIILDPSGDADSDNLTNAEETSLGTDILDPDTDGDGLTDDVETNTGVFANEQDTGTDPLDDDTDQGGINDGLEIKWGFDPLDAGDDPSFNILAWVEYADMGRRYPNTLDAIHQYIPDCSITESTTTDPNELAEELEGKNILFLPAQENLYNGFSWGELFGEVLRGFVEDGGLIIALHRESGYILEGAGLMDVTNQGSVWGESLRILAPDHPLSEGVAYPVTARESTNYWLVEDPDVEVILSRDIDDSPIIVTRPYGSGSVVLIGFDYYEYDDNSARFLANTIEWSLMF